MSLNLIPWQKVLFCWENLIQQGKDLKLKRCDAEKLVKFLKYVSFIGFKITYGLQVLGVCSCSPFVLITTQRVGIRDYTS
jgi:hypothetical protein